MNNQSEENRFVQPIISTQPTIQQPSKKVNSVGIEPAVVQSIEISNVETMNISTVSQVASYNTTSIRSRQNKRKISEMSDGDVSNTSYKRRYII